MFIFLNFKSSLASARRSWIFNSWGHLLTFIIWLQSRVKRKKDNNAAHELLNQLISFKNGRRNSLSSLNQLISFENGKRNSLSCVYLIKKGQIQSSSSWADKVTPFENEVSYNYLWVPLVWNKTYRLQQMSKIFVPTRFQHYFLSTCMLWNLFIFVEFSGSRIFLFSIDPCQNSSYFY